MRRRQALHTYASVQSSRHDLRAGEAEFRRSTAPVLTKPQAVRKRTFGEAVTLFCERFAASGWLLLLGIVFAAAILNARSTGAMP